MKKTIYIIFSIFFIVAYTQHVYAEDIVPPADPIIVESIPPADPVPEEIPPVVVEEETEEEIVIPIPQETVFIRNGETVVYSGSINLPEEGTVDVVDSTGVSHGVNKRSVLGLLAILDQGDDNFSLSSIIYYSSFNSLYIKCITVQSEESCDNWQYTVNNATPFTGIDSTNITGGESIGLYFGNPYRVVFDSLVTGNSLIATAEKYNYLENTWSPRTNVTIGITVSNPDDPYNPTVVATAAVDNSGVASLTVPDSGDYMVGIAEDFYFPTFPLTVNPIVSDSSGGSSVPLPESFSTQKAIEYLFAVQGEDGSFGSHEMYTDWVAIAYGAFGIIGQHRDSLVSYLASHSPISPFLTDNERRAMALLSLGLNPYNFEGSDYVTAITSKFDGTQFGEASLVNDDIFALIPLSRAGFTSHDDIIVKDIAFIISQQNPDGSWEGSVDMTAAAIQALGAFRDVVNARDSIDKAVVYIKSMQQNDGGFGSIFTSAWVAQAQKTVNQIWTKEGKSISDYFILHQTSDGAVLPSTDITTQRIWATSYVIPGSLGLPWTDIMQNVPKPVGPVLATTLPEVPVEEIKIEPEIIAVAIEEKKVGNVIIQEEKVIIKKEENKITPIVEEIIKPELVEQTLLASAATPSPSIPLPIVIVSSITLLGIITIMKFAW
jgi:hypothetical protein